MDVHSTQNPNEDLFMEQAYKRAWFKVKPRCVWAQIIEKERIVQTKVGKVTVKPGDIVSEDRRNSSTLCKIFPTNFLEHYEPTKSIAGKFTKFNPKSGVGWASRVSHDFILTLDNGKQVRGNRGDYIFVDEDQYSLSLLNPSEFNQTYQRVISMDEVQNILVSAHLFT